MTLGQIKTFVAAAKHLNLTKASQELRMSQPSISRQLKNLQDECKVILYRRVSNGIELTEEGRGFLSSAELLLMQLAMMNRRWSAPLKTETLTVGGSHAPSAVLLPSLLALFQKSRPQVQLTLRTHDNTPMEQLVLKSEVEIAVITAPSFNPQLVVEPFRKERTRVFASMHHRLGKRKELTPAELASAPLIVRQASGGKGGVHKVLQQMENEGLRPNIAMRCESVEGVKTQVKMGMGLGILYQDQIESDLRAGKFKIIKVPKLSFDAESFIVYRRDRSLSAHARDFLSVLRQYRQKHRRINGTRRAARNISSKRSQREKAAFAQLHLPSDSRRERPVVSGDDKCNPSFFVQTE